MKSNLIQRVLEHEKKSNGDHIYEGLKLDHRSQIIDNIAMIYGNGLGKWISL